MDMPVLDHDPTEFVSVLDYNMEDIEQINVNEFLSMNATPTSLNAPSMNFPRN